MTPPERWKSIAGFEGRFEVSTYGRVRSVSRAVPSPRHGDGATRVIKSRIIAAHSRSGYPMIALTNDDGVRIGKQVHRLVAEAFIPNPCGHPEVNHLDTDRTNARATNLEWCTRSMNMSYAYRMGTRPVGSEHHFAKLARDEGGRCLPASS